MIEDFYILTNTPFTRDIPTAELYASVSMEEILGRLEHAAKRQLFAVMTGDCGTGKTTIVRKLNDTLNPSEFMLLYLV